MTECIEAIPQGVAQAKPEALPVNLNTIPTALTTCGNWSVWRYELDGRGAWKKPPRKAVPPFPKIDPTQPERWCSFEQAKTAYERGKVDGIGFALDGKGVVAVDLDHCLDPDTGELTEDARAVVTEFDGTYIERSPSGCGIRIFCRGQLPKGGYKSAEHGFEVYQARRYMTVTGQTMCQPGTGVEESQEALDWLLAAYFSDSQAEAAPVVIEASASPQGGTEGGPSDDDVLRVARREAKFSNLYDAGNLDPYNGDHSSADLAMMNKLAFYSGEPSQMARLFQASALGQRDKANRPDYIERTVNKALADTPKRFDWSRDRRGYAGSQKKLGNKGNKVTNSINPSNDGSSREFVAVTKEENLGNTGNNFAPYYFTRFPDGRVVDGIGQPHEEVRAPGLYFVGVSLKGSEPEWEAPLWISIPFELLASCDDGEGHGHCLVIRFKSIHGKVQTWTVPRSLIVTQGGAEISQKLYGMGFRMSLKHGAAHIREFLNWAKPDVTALAVPRTGWARNHFVLPDRVFGPDPSSVFYQTDDPSPSRFGVSGSLTGWRKGVATPVEPYDLPVFAISAAFAGPLVGPLSIQTGGFHFVSTSSTGKTNAMRWALSVWGRHEKLVQTWFGTKVGFEMTAASYSDCLMVLDELGQADPRDVGDLIYLLCNEAGRMRGNARLTYRSIQRWSLMLLSTGEKTLAQVMGEAGKLPMAGQELRIVNVPSDAGDECGIFTGLEPRSERERLAKEISDAADTHHGTPIREFLSQLSARDGFAFEADKQRVHYLASNMAGQTATSEVRRAALRFAVVAHAGELATLWNITGWPVGRAEQAARAMFKRWQAEWGSGRKDETNFLDRLDEWLAGNQMGHFLVIDPLTRRVIDDKNATSMKPFYGYQSRRSGGDGWAYHLNAAGWAAATKGMSREIALDALRKAGRLGGIDPGGKKGLAMRIDGILGRFYVVCDA